MTELDDINIKHIKLTDGTEIVTMITSTLGESVLNIEKPLLLNFMYEEDDSISYYFTRYCPFSRDGKVKLNAQNVVAYSDVTTDLKARYIRSALKMSKGIQVPFEDDTDSEAPETERHVMLSDKIVH